MNKLRIASIIRKITGIPNLTLYIRKKKKIIDRIIYRKKYSTEDIIRILKESGVQPGHPVIVHSAMSQLFNYNGTPDDLIDGLLEFLGPEGTLCMPAFPKDKYNTSKIFDVNETPSAAGYLTEVFRRREGVLRSMNQLHSVCALGKDAEKIVNDHHHSRICFDEHSPYYIIGQLNGYVVDIGLPEYYIGTGGHVCEALLFDKLEYFKNKFTESIEFTYKDKDGDIVKHVMLTKSAKPYIRSHSTKLIDTYFDKNKFHRVKLSNIWINIFDMKYLYTRLYELALEGKTIYKSPKMDNK